MFLRCELFNTDLAAQRLVQYWERRFEVFGPVKAYLPLTLENMEEDTAALENGTIGIAPYKVDDTGRQAIIYDPSNMDPTMHTRESCTRALWYYIHAVLEDESTQKYGVLVLVTPKDVKLSQVDLKQRVMLIRTIKKCVPMRVSAIHICKPAYFFGLIWHYVKIFFGKKLRGRVHVHSGSEFQIVMKLETFGMDRSNLPSDVGGLVVFDQIGWLRTRRLHGL